MQQFIDVMGTYTLWGLAIEILLLIALVPAFMKVCIWHDLVRDQHQSWLYQLRDLRKQLRSVKEGVEVTRIQLPAILSSGPMRLILPLALKFL